MIRNDVIKYINENWLKTIRVQKQDDERRIGLPYPFIVPSIKDSFQELYYWDTYFACKGLIICDQLPLAKNCADNMMYLVNRYGFMPNSNLFSMINRSQPPFLSMLVADIYEQAKDKEWLLIAYDVLKKEYQFWKNKRNTSTGLNQYSYDIFNENIFETYKAVCERTSLSFHGRDVEDVVQNVMIDAESGWDFNPRTATRQKDYLWVDLNSNLYIYEKNFAYFSKELSLNEENYWLECAYKRKELMNDLLYNGEAFFDYNFKTKTHSDVFSCASFYPLWAEVATKEQAEKTVKKLHLLEYEYGICACQQNEIFGNFQWDYPNGWAPLHYIVINALLNYGYEKDAKRIAKKYMSVIERVFEATGSLWEKYNVVNGSLEVSSEYGTPEMMGWTAGVYMYCNELIYKK